MKTLIILDVQNDFMPEGALGIQEGHQIVPIINDMVYKFDLVLATQDWHPANHKSFASNNAGKKVYDTIILQGIEQILWPDHCVQGSFGAEFHPKLNMKPVEAIFRKGMDPMIDSYSGFYDNGHQKSSGLAGYLREKGAKELYFCGLAGDICVYYSILDALNEGFNITLFIDATRPLKNAQFVKQNEELKLKGVQFKLSTEFFD